MGISEAIGAQLRRPSGPLAPVAGAAMRLINSRPYRHALSALDVQPGEDVLELGVGPGEGVRALCQLTGSGRVWGVDHSQAMIARASARNAGAIASGRATLRLSKFEALPLEDASVERVLAVNVAYFWGDGAAVIAEVGRVLKPGGRLSVYVTDAAVMSRWRFAGAETHGLFTPEGLERYLAQAPFRSARVSVRKLKLPFSVQGIVATADL